ncbi:MAG: hypothetical protein CMJ18_04980 [Phycisphaeraceae bacterium]|nr:hypothetical protein [Phycisphaeraceae bacterium]
MRTTRGSLVRAALPFLIACGASTALALDGAGDLELQMLNDWTAFEIVTQGDDIGAISDPGYGSTASRGSYDGLGGYLSGGKLSIYVNHETGNAAISRVDVDLERFQQAVDSMIDDGATAFPLSFVTGMGYAYDRIFDGSYHAVDDPNPVAEGTPAIVNYGNANFDGFCSGSSYVPHAFGTDRGFVDPVYITGEEVTGGRFYAVDQVTDTMWEVPDFGLGRWENASLVDTGNTTHVGVLLFSDVGSSPGDYIRMYVGEKGVDANDDGEIDFLERNGMRGGTVYYFDPDTGFRTDDLPDGAVTGLWSTSTAGALRETKLEDVHTNPNDGMEVVFADQTDGVYRMDLEMQFTSGELDTNASTVNIFQIDDGSDSPVRAPDNLTWTRNGLVYVQEDGSGDDVWQMNPDGSDLIQIASAFSEPSGIFDVSELAGYAAGSVLLSSMQGGPAQLSALISPTALKIPEPATVGVVILGMGVGYRARRAFRRPIRE